MPDSPWTPLEHVHVADQWVATASRQDFVDAALADCAYAEAHGRVRTRLIFDANGQGVSLAQTDPAFRHSIDEADVVHADGQFLVKISQRYCAAPIAERAPTTDMIHDFAKACEASGHSFYLLGGPEAVNAACAVRLGELYPRLRIAGRHHGFFRGREEDVLADIAAARPDFLWVGLGKPLEQAFCVTYRDRLDAVWTITCGGCFNFITSDYSRAPMWMQEAGLEWVYRMVTEPRKLAWRYITTTPRALVTALRKSDRRVRTMAYDDAAPTDVNLTATV